jgi:hypothetical protein
MIFKKIKGNQNKIQTPGRKRKIFLTISLSLSLLFGKPRLGSSQSSSPNFGNQEIYERVIDDPELDFLEQNYQQVISAKGESNPITAPTNRGPSNFPTQPSAGRPPSRPATGTIVHRLNNGLGAAANPAGAGGGADEFDDQCPVPKKEQSQKPEIFDDRSNYSKKKKKSSQQCELGEEFQKDEKYGGFAYKLDTNGNLILKVKTKTGSEILLTYDKTLEKYYHQDVYKLETPKNFDSKKARSLKPKDRIEYLKKTVPRDKVIEFQIANAKSLSTENFRSVPGFIGAQKEPGTLYINKETMQVHFVNDRTNIWRTTVIRSGNALIALAKNNFHLFPNAAK